VPCAAGKACQPTNACHAGAITCGSGAPVCGDTGLALADGTDCGPDQVCSGGACIACASGTPCTPANPCHAGVIACASGTPACGDTGAPLGDGSACGSDLVCSGGFCVACAAGVGCTPTNACHAGTVSCQSGAPVCVDTGAAVQDGTPCGGSRTCRAGRCMAASAGCGISGAPTGSLARTVTVALTTTRSYELLVPSTYDPATPLPLVYVFHAQNGSIAQAKGLGLQDVPGASASAIFVFPQGVAFESYGIGWNEHCTGYDMPFFDAMQEATGSAYCVDLERVFAAGFSWGADFANNLGCCRGNQVRAVAASSGADGNYNPSCLPSLPALRLSYADNDIYPQSAFDIAVGLYRTAHHCSTSSDPLASPCLSYRGCDAPVIECRYPGLGHTLPAGWAGDVWSWFSSFP